MAAEITESDIPKYEGILTQGKEKLEHLKSWKEKADSPTPEFQEELRTALQFCNAAFGIFRDHPQFNRLADELAEAAVELRNHLGEALMPLEKYYLLGRGVFEIGRVTVASGQYFQEIPYYGPPRPCAGEALEITKFYEWKIIDCPRADIKPNTPVKTIYHLEKGQMNGPYYVLGMSAPSMHATIQMFQGDSKPTFFQLEEMIVKRLMDEQQGNNSGFAAASYSGPRGK